MNLETMLERLGLTAERGAVLRRLEQADDAGAPADWRHLGAVLAHTLAPGGAAAPAVPWPAVNPSRRPLVLGLAGAQGSGKSTLAAELVRHLNAAGTSAVACSLDDFYLSRARRAALADTVHPLLATRGVPGTHDVDQAVAVIGRLGGTSAVALPAFDKAADEPLPPRHWRRVTAPVDVLVLEGWCVGAAPEAETALARPINELEVAEDRDGVWRRWVNDQLAGSYRTLWAELHGLVFLRIPDWHAVLRWRGQQEQALPAERRMTAAALQRFVAHYQRLTLAMLRTMPRRADLVAGLNAAHGLADLRRKGRPGHSESIQRPADRMPPA